MYKGASRFQQGMRGSAPRPRAESLWSSDRNGILRYLVDKSEECGATHLIVEMSDWMLARLILRLHDDGLLANDWLDTIVLDVETALDAGGEEVRLTPHQRRVSETVIPEFINRARRAEEF